ncbi:MAG TPA: O-antigen ligase family protein, partial [Planctomycetota bacterium]|nr:O-antigen ligase family protein [Planctomycetota bacterium]
MFEVSCKPRYAERCFSMFSYLFYLVAQVQKSPLTALIKSILLLMLVVVPLSFTHRTPASEDLKALLLSSLTAACATLWLLRGAWHGSWLLPDKGVLSALLCTVLIGALSLSWSSAPHATLAEIWRVCVLALLFLVSCSVSEAGFARSFCLTVSLVAVLLSVYGILQRLGLDPLVWQNVPRGRVHSFCGHPNILASVLVFSIPITLCALEHSATRSQAWLQRTCLFFQAACLFFTVSRAGWLAAIAALVFYFYFRRRHKEMLPITSGLAPLLAGVVAAAVYGPGVDPLMTDPSKAPAISLETRQLIWRGAADMISSQPLLGYGAGSFNSVFPEFRPLNFGEVNPRINVLHAHSELLEQTAETGVAGCVAFLAFLFLTLRMGWRSLQENTAESGWFSGLLSGGAGLIIHGMFDVTLRFALPSALLWMTLGLLARSPTSPVQLSLQRAPALICASLLSVLLALGTLRLTLFPYLSLIEQQHGAMLKERAEWERAADVFARAAQIYPANSDAHYERAVCLVELERYGDALK